MWRLCFRFFLLLCPGTGAVALCDNGRFNIHVDLPEKAAYICSEEFWPFPNRALPSISTKYRQEDSSYTCIDTQIVYTSLIPNSGAHRPKAAKYGEYIYCPPQRWLHNLKHGGVAFLYHPCVHPHLKGELSRVARSCMYKHILTPLTSLSIERPLALAAWGSSLEMSHIDLKAVKEWLQVNIFRDHENKIENILLYDYLLIQPSAKVSDQEDTEVCPGSPLQVLEISTNKKRLNKTQLRKRRAASAVHSFKGRATTVDFHHGERPLHNVSSEAQAVANVKLHSDVPPVLKTDIDNTSAPVLSVNVTFPSPGAVQPVEDTGNSIHASQINKRDGDVVPEPEFHGNINISKNNAKDSSNSSLDFLSAEHFKNTLEKGGNIKENLLPPKNQEPNSPKSQQDMEYRNDTARKAQVSSSENLAPKLNGNPLASAPAPGPDLSSNKNECKCQHEPAANLPPKAQVRSGPGHRRKLDVYSSTPRTEEATWAAASLIFLFVLLTVCVLYTQIHKKFQKSQSLYWRSGSTCLETESVASVIKRRLKQGYSKRKKWIGRKKPPVLLYDRLSESSD